MEGGVRGVTRWVECLSSRMCYKISISSHARAQVPLGNALLAKLHFGDAKPGEAPLRGNARAEVELGHEAPVARNSHGSM